MKLLITGANGLYGSKLAKLAISKGIDVYSSDLNECSFCGQFVRIDISNQTQVVEAFKTIKPDVVVHGAALTDVDKCELNKELAWRVNVDGTKHIAEACQSINTFLFFVSTDYVFSGEKGYYSEYDARDPLNYYGLTKVEAEEIVKCLPAYFIARPSVIYGSTPAAGKVNFVLWLIETLKKGECVKILTDQWNTPTLNTNLAEMTVEVIERRLTGIYHLCGATRVSRFEFANRIADVFDLDKRLIDEVTSSHFTWPAKRPSDSSLDTSKAQRNLKCGPISLDKALKQLKQELNQMSI